MTLWAINGEPFHPDRIDADPTLGAVELWKVRAQNVEHPLHLHLAPFQVVSVGGNDPGPWNQGWKDTVSLDNGDDAELLVHFDGFEGRYVFHCHNLEHEDMQMMGNFEVTCADARAPMTAMPAAGPRPSPGWRRALMVGLDPALGGQDRGAVGGGPHRGMEQPGLAGPGDAGERGASIRGRVQAAGDLQ